eukprot:CAMPEP_0170643518 /NCGR_PEP_ID=MMETSP0224-20130122/41932_1 /TAXON_ID=285029 /ORGANISM="Togula jolla, Strain CCCM 725" /LENGTH=92 /DNA_ID=CAMNT_0010974359 /DNA_START=99 /DNA_END=378 /DNA_ORIENTATION=-
MPKSAMGAQQRYGEAMQQSKFLPRQDSVVFKSGTTSGHDAASRWEERQRRRRRSPPGSYGEMLRGHAMLSLCLVAQVPNQGDESQDSETDSS